MENHKKKGNRKSLAGKRQSFAWKMEKYYRWFRLYIRSVKAVEQQIGEKVWPC
jgi:hypothetical protein